MHKLEKRQAIEGPEGKVVDNNVSIISSQSFIVIFVSPYNLITTYKQGVVRRIICPSDVLGQGGNNNGGRYCDRCSCRDAHCNYDCRKCGGVVHNDRYCDRCSCRENDCHYDCRKCVNDNSGWSNNNNQGSNGGQNNNWSNSGNVNCGSCNCRRNDCNNTCLKCHRNVNPSNNYPGNSGSSWGNNNNGGWGNSGWRKNNKVKQRINA